MIAKYGGICHYCGKATKQGVDTYDPESKRSYHEACDEAQPPGPEAFELAARLGFVPSDEASIRAAIPRWQVSEDRILRLLHEADRSAAAGRPAPQTH